MKQFECTLNLTSSHTVINQLSSLLDSVKAITVRELQYTTISANQQALTINIDGFSDHPYLLSGNTNSRYTKLIMLQKTDSTTINYFNPSTDAYDVYHDQGSSMSNFVITCLIDNEYNSDINSSNPLLVKIIFFYE